MNLGTYVGKQLKHDWGKHIGVSRSRLLLSSELVINGGFDMDTVWNIHNAAGTIENGKFVVNKDMGGE